MNRTETSVYCMNFTHPSNFFRIKYKWRQNFLSSLVQIKNIDSHIFQHHWCNDDHFSAAFVDCSVEARLPDDFLKKTVIHVHH